MTDSSWQQPQWCAGVRRRLLKWFELRKRDLPWRRTTDPYAVWISEIMLQQTQVATVIPYFERFMTRFPSVQVLAAAEEEEVLRHWEGLGYYRRARQLHAAAKKVVAEHEGVFPTEFAAVLALPGIGRYTAGAILSIACDQRLPVVEANTLRLYSRLIGLEQSPTEAAANRLLWQVAEAVLPQKKSGLFNQAAMELGSLVCTPRSPACDECVLASFCAANEKGLQESIPGKVKKLEYESRQHWGIVIQQRGRTLMRCCAAGEHWAGLWDVPRYDVTEIDQRVPFIEDQLKAQYGLAVELGDKLLAMKHGVTRYRIQLDIYRGRCRAKVVQQPVVAESALSLAENSLGQRDWGWFSLSELDSLALNTTGRKVVKLLQSS